MTRPTFCELHHLPVVFARLAVPISTLHEDPTNARKHERRNLEAIRDSLEKFGWRDVLHALEDGTVIAGNARLRVAKELGWTHAPVLRFKDRAAARAFAIAHNRTAELAQWDMAQLAADLAELPADLAGVVGFSPDEIEQLLRQPLDAATLDAIEQIPQPRKAGGAVRQGGLSITFDAEQERIVRKAAAAAGDAQAKDLPGTVAKILRAYLNPASKRKR